MATVYHGTKPMLEFVQIPEQVEIKRRRRRFAVRTPENPRVKTVPLHKQVTQPTINVKWISPQFSANTAQIRPKARRGILEIKSSKRTVWPLQFDQEDDSPQISVYPSLAPHLMLNHDFDQTTTDMEQTHRQSLVDQQTSYTDQEVPDMCANLAVPDMTTPEHSHSPTSLNDPNATAMDEESHSNYMNHLSLSCTENMEELSEQVGCMSLEDNSHTTAMSINTMQLNEDSSPQLELSDYPPSQFKSLPNDHPDSQGNEDVSTQIKQNKSSHLANSSHEATMCKKFGESKNNDLTFKPPSTSTPYHLRNLSLNQASCFSQFSKFTNSTSKKPANSDFVLCLTNSSYQDDNNELDRCEVTDSSHTTCEGCTMPDDSSFILAAETPQHLWCSPEVKVVDNTFSK